MVAMATQGRQNITLSGCGISPGLAVGTAFVYQDILQRDHERYDIDAQQVEEEYARIERAVDEVLGDLEVAAERVERDLDSHLADIFRAHRTILRDRSLAEEFKDELTRELVNAEHVVQRVLHRWIRRFGGANKEAVVLRGEDLADLCRRLLRALIGIQAHTLEHMPESSVLVARQLLPSDTVHLSRKSTVAVVVAFGGPGSHAALLTRELGIPAVAQLAGELERIFPGDVLLVNGSSGAVTVAPDEKARARFEQEMERANTQIAQSRKRCHEPASTPSGIRVQVFANIGCQEDAVLAAENGADGIGLYRIEWPYLSRKTLPSEDELLAEIDCAIAPFNGRPVVVRLLDAGADKEVPFLNLPAEVDPALGRRGIRLLLEYPDLLNVQLRALLRLSKEHDVSILVPMVTLAEEVERVAELLARAAADLHTHHAPALGAMIETPAAALCAADVARHADFLSIGTNDLTQYVMAAGRENALVSDYFRDDHPAVLRLLHLIQEDVREKPVAVCGELAARESALAALIEAGIRTLSVAPGRVPAVKEAVRHFGEARLAQSRQ
jgi:phosphoenolpyruvate-protein phosphotransferase